MELTILSDIRQFVLDTDEAQRSLERLQRDCAEWARDSEHRDLAQVMYMANRLEFDVCKMLSGYVSLERQYREDADWVVFDDIHRTFGSLNIMFHDLKKLRTELNQAYIPPKDLKRLEIDLGRLRKSIRQLQKHLGKGERDASH
jgi:hypothetical protein